MNKKIVNIELLKTPVEMYGREGFQLKVWFKDKKEPYEAWSGYLETFINNDIMKELTDIANKNFNHD